MGYVLTIDEGTTSTRALVFDSSGEILGVEQEEFKQYYPQPGWVEHDAQEIWDTTAKVSINLVKRLVDEGAVSAEANQANSIEAIAITNQRETTVVWDAEGKPVHNAIVWQCRRTSEYCKQLNEDKVFADLVREQTGLLIDSYFSGAKLKWILDNAISDSQGLKFGTIDSWLVYKLTGNHYTEPSNASRTMLYSLKDSKWSDEILAKLKIPLSLLPEVIASNANFGETDLFAGLLNYKVSVRSVMGDQQSALYAYLAANSDDVQAHENCQIQGMRSDDECSLLGVNESKRNKHNEVVGDLHKLGAAKVTYGTGAFALVPSGKFQLCDGLLTSSAYIHTEAAGTLRDFPSQLYAVEGSVLMAGALVQWLRDEFEFIESSPEIEALAQGVESSAGVCLIPAHAGLGAPHWSEDIRAALLGMTRGSNRGHVARAALEAIAFSVKDVFEALDSSVRDCIAYLNVDGGASKNDLLMQVQADILDIPVRRYKSAEMTALGAAAMTGLLAYELELEKEFVPNAENSEKLLEQYKVWSKYLNLLMN